MQLTSNDVSEEPCRIVVKDPVPEWEKTDDVSLDTSLAGCVLRKPFGHGGLFLDIGVNGRDGGCTGACDFFVFLAVVEVDEEDLGQEAADVVQSHGC